MFCQIGLNILFLNFKFKKIYFLPILCRKINNYLYLRTIKIEILSKLSHLLPISYSMFFISYDLIHILNNLQTSKCRKLCIDECWDSDLGNTNNKQSSNRMYSRSQTL